MKRTAFVWSLLLTAISMSDASAQTVLRSTDSTQIYVAALRAVLESVVHRPDSTRIWIQPNRAGVPGAEAVAEIQRTFPSASRVFRCKCPGSGAHSETMVSSFKWV
jgi:hypothetical protein